MYYICFLSANILLDEMLVAKISDFGLTRASANHTSTTVVTERIVGTRAYMAPEALRGKITPKSDVFSFGVVGSLQMCFFFALCLQPLPRFLALPARCSQRAEPTESRCY